MEVFPYIGFEGRCEEALEFYKKAIGAEIISLMRFQQSPVPHPTDGCGAMENNKIMHAAFRVGKTMLMATDGRNSGKVQFQGIFLNLSVDSPAEAEKYFNALADGGTVQMPLAKTFFSPSFGMVHDRFGVVWMVVVLVQP